MTRKRAGWHKQDVLAAVRKKGTTLSQLSRDCGLGRQTLYGALDKRYPRANAIIAEFIGVSRHEIWPDWFGPDDAPLALTHHPIRNTTKAKAAA